VLSTVINKRHPGLASSSANSFSRPARVASMSSRKVLASISLSLNGIVRHAHPTVSNGDPVARASSRENPTGALTGCQNGGEEGSIWRKST
jgi:hypothetical protein